MKFAAVLLTLTLARLAHSATLSSKFEDYIQTIQAELLRYNHHEVDIVALSQGSLRQTLFTIQTIAALYENKYPPLESVRIDTKSLEDGIGNYRKAIEQLEYAKKNKASAEILNARTTKKDISEARLTQQLDGQGWIEIPGGKTEALLKTIKAVPWDNESKEKNDSYQMMAVQLQRVDQTDWNMTVLEGQGVHDLRKEMRWYKLQFGALNDILGTSSPQMAGTAPKCAGPATIAKPSQTGGLCLISACLHNQISEIYDVFGAIKDEGEGHAGLGEEIDQALLKPAQDLYARVKKDHLFQNLALEFQQCVEKE